MPLQLQRWTPSLIVPKEWIGCPKSWWEREAQPNESIIDHTKQSWYFSNATSALTLDAELNRYIITYIGLYKLMNVAPINLFGKLDWTQCQLIAPEEVSYNDTKYILRECNYFITTIIIFE
ncbi:Hypothetical_protein [Hexamita inflata]|uniref:Hypothetical_protein n=1 Tax=Hexamita inflata TaxID=28002 RepID=A0AA86P121_9EUKA|nr:Hypothetical protein HINF_LOCUS16763 [Hexamita inflata]